ncbi:MAG: 4Fe-4S dicluster domain-containing protein [Candidatus Hodarchaeales archaeon]|jgi:heterodisulfide reductase subunit C
MIESVEVQESTELPKEFKELFDLVKLCYQCGTCAGGCPVFKQHSEFNPRSIMEKILFGNIQEVIDEEQIWYCSMCYTCSVRCPQNIDIAHIITNMKNLAVKVKNAPPGIMAEIQAIADTGTTTVISQSILKKRERLELPELPPTDTNEIKKLLEMMDAYQIAKAKEDNNQ